MISTSKVLLALTVGSSWTGAASLPQDGLSSLEADGDCNVYSDSEKSMALLQASRGIQKAMADNVEEASAGILPQVDKAGLYKATESASLEAGNATPVLSIAEVQDDVYPPLQSEEEFAYDYPRDDNPKFQPAEASATAAPSPFTPHSVGTTTVSPEEIERLKKELEKARENANKSMTKRDGLSDKWLKARDALETDKEMLNKVSEQLTEVAEKLESARQTIKKATKEEVSLKDEVKTLNKTLANETAAEKEAREALQFSITDAQTNEQKVAELEAKLKKIAPEEAAAVRTLSSAVVLLCAVVGAQSS